MSSPDKQVSRRNFLKGAALSTAAVAGAGLLAGCNSSDPSVGAGIPKKWDREADVVVIGTGTAGMSAAVEAVEAGAKVLMLEKYEIIGGASAGCQVYCAYDSKLNLPQSYPGVVDSADLMFEDSMKAGQNLADPEQVRILCDQSPDGISFLMDHGCEFLDYHRPSEGRAGQGRFMLKVGGSAPSTLLKTVESKGGEVLINTKATEFIREGLFSGRVLGLKAIDETGKEITIKANRAVVMATGNWTDDKAKVLRHWPTLPKETVELGDLYASFGIPFGPFTGEGIEAAQRIGAATRHMDYFAPEGYYSTMEYQKLQVAGSGITRLPFELHVNKNGVRFTNEGKTRGLIAEDVLRQPDYTYFVIYDSQLITDKIPGLLMPWAPMEKIDEWVKAGYMIKADTIEELAANFEKSFKVPAAAVIDTVTKYNGYCDTGVDEEFHKEKLYLYKVNQPPFYTSPPQTVRLSLTLGGVDANTKAQVLDLDGQVIPGLYAAGMCAGGHFGRDSIMGNWQMNAVVFGRIAGKGAAAETPVG